jgi:hypothetical protein
MRKGSNVRKAGPRPAVSRPARSFGKPMGVRPAATGPVVGAPRRTFTGRRGCLGTIISLVVTLIAIAICYFVVIPFFSN